MAKTCIVTYIFLSTCCAGRCSRTSRRV